MATAQVPGIHGAGRGSIGTESRTDEVTFIDIREVYTPAASARVSPGSLAAIVRRGLPKWLRAIRGVTRRPACNKTR